jgi:hypothetical protein
MSTGGGKDAQEAARINEELSGRAQAIGLPAIRGSLAYAGGALQGPALPGYVESAYRGAGTTAMEQGRAGERTARSQLVAGLRAAGGGGPSLRDYGRTSAGAAQDLAQQVGSIGVSRAMAGIGQRNRMLSVLAGGGASALDLAGAYGGQANRGLALLGADPGAYPYVVGGLSTLSGLAGKYFEKHPLGGVG